MKKPLLFLAVIAGIIGLSAADLAQAAVAPKRVVAKIVAASNADLAKIANVGQAGRQSSFARKMAGKVILRTQGRGEAYYINPANLKKYYLGRQGKDWRVSADRTSAIINQSAATINKTAAGPQPVRISAGQTQSPAPVLKRISMAAAASFIDAAGNGAWSAAAVSANEPVGFDSAASGSSSVVDNRQAGANAEQSATAASGNSQSSASGGFGDTQPATETETIPAGTVAPPAGNPAADQLPSNPPSPDTPPIVVPPAAPPVEAVVPPAPPAPAQPAAPVLLISPAAGEKIILGTSHLVRWNPAAVKGSPAAVIITLSAGGRETAIFSPAHPDLPNSGSYLWSVPLDLPAGSNYTIRVWNNAGYSHTNDFVESAPFSLAPQFITALSPNGGEIYYPGDTASLRWTSENMPSDAKLAVILAPAGNDFGLSLFSDLSASGSISWVVPAELAAGDYRIGIRCHTLANENCRAFPDYSDSFFTIKPMVNYAVRISAGAANATIPAAVNLTAAVEPAVAPGHSLRIYEIGKTAPLADCGAGSSQCAVQFSSAIVGSANFQARIENINDGAARAASSIITVTWSEPLPPQPIINTVIAPTGGETVLMGGSYTVQWDTAAVNGSPSRVIITLSAGGRETAMFSPVHPDLPNSGSYLWSVPLDLPAGSNYTIRVWNNAGYSHTNDFVESGQFSLTAP